MMVWSDHQYILKYHPEVTGFEVVSGTTSSPGLVLKEWLRCNLANLKYLSWGRRRMDETEVLVFAETVNQHVSLSSMVKALGKRCCYVQTAHFEEADEAREVNRIERDFELTLLDWVKSFLKSTVLIPHVLIESRRYEGGLRKFYVRQLFRSCGYWFWLKSLLMQLPSRWVLTANDHNHWNRMLYALARWDGRKTAYVQHASVSDIFPALDFDVAFLDGLVSQGIYQQIANRKGLPLTVGKILLCGAQKQTNDLKSAKISQVIGIAISKFTVLDVALELIDGLLENDRQVLLRSHPSESQDRIEAYQEWTACRPGLEFQEGTVPIRVYLADVGMVLAGDSSILLETAIAGRCAVYAQTLSGQGLYDYYGFVQNGIALALDASGDLGAQLRDWKTYMSSTEYARCIRRYSASFGTEWHGHEGQWAVHQWESMGLSELAGDS